MTADNIPTKVLFPDDAAVKTVAAPSPGSMIQTAIDKGVSPTELTAFYDLYERDQAAQALRAFNAAVTAFKADPPVILKDAEVDFTSRKTGNRTHYKHADLARIVEAVTPSLCAHGLTVRWDVDQTDAAGKINVTCVLSHVQGHSESVAMRGAPDSSGQKKNPIQEVGSTVSYLQRYTLMSVLGLAAKGVDNDGGRMAESDANKITDDQVLQIEAYISDNEIPQDAINSYLMAKGYTGFDELPAVSFKSFMGMLQRSVAAK